MQKNKQEKSPIKERILQYLDIKGITKYAFYKESGVSRGILDQDTGISEENLSRFLSFAQDISPIWILTGKGEIFNTKSIDNAYNSEVVQIVGSNVGERKVQKTPTNKTIYDDHRPVSIVSDLYPADGNNLGDMTVIPIVDISAAAATGGAGAYNTDYLVPTDTIVLPPQMVHRGGRYHCIRIKGQSMAPTLQDGSYIIVRLLDRTEWADIKNEYVYVVTNNDGEAFIKRVRNRLHEHGFIVCTSDNPDKNAYPNFNLWEEEINSILYVEWYLSAKMPNIHATYYNQMQEMRDDLDDIKDFLQRNFKKPIKGD